jgi:hypothetical protein
MGSFEQFIRIALYMVAGYFLGDATAQGAEVQGAISGVIGLGTFGWWFYKNRKAIKG